MNAKVSSFQNLSACTDFADLISTLKAALKDHPAAYTQALAAYGYDPNFRNERRHPDKSILNQVSTEIPVVILYVSFHIACINSKALEHVLATVAPLIRINPAAMIRNMQKCYTENGVTTVQDGSPQGRSAWMSSPYLHGKNGYRGYPRMRDEEVENAIRTAVREGRQILAHCNGDAASEQFITSFEKAAEQLPAVPHRYSR